MCSGISGAAASENCLELGLTVTLGDRARIMLRLNGGGVRCFLPSGDTLVFVATGGVVTLLLARLAIGATDARRRVLRQRRMRRAERSANEEYGRGKRPNIMWHA